MRDLTACCLSSVSLLHVVAGVGLGFVLVSLLNLTGNLLLYGAVLLVVGLLGHMVVKK